MKNKYDFRVKADAAKIINIAEELFGGQDS